MATKKTENKDQTCPNCGYCPHCGHSPQRLQPYIPWYPVTQPIPSPWFTYPPLHQIPWTWTVSNDLSTSNIDLMNGGNTVTFPLTEFTGGHRSS